MTHLSAGSEGPPPTPQAACRTARPIVIGLDVGTTAVKAVGFEPGGAGVLAAAERGYPLQEPRPSWQVQDPVVVAAAVVGALADCVAACGRRDVHFVALSTAMHGLAALDDDGAPLTPLLTWADARGAEQARRLRACGTAGVLHRMTGAPVHPMTPLVKLVWFADEEPAVVRRARHWVGVKEWVVATLTGHLATEPSSASGTGLAAIDGTGWAPDALAAAGVQTDRLAPILPATHTLPLSAQVAARTGLRCGTPVVLGGADGPLSTLAVGAVTPGTAGLSIGTSAAVRTLVARPGVDDGLSLFCYALLPGTWVLGGAVSNGGCVVPWGADTLALAPDGDEGVPGVLGVLSVAAKVSAGADGLLAVPYLLPERAPRWDPDLPGALLGLRRRHTPGHIARALVEGVALQLAMVLSAVEQLHRVDHVLATGGAFRSPLWARVVSDALDRRVTVTSAAEGAALGAAAVGMMAVGAASTPVEALARLRSSEASADDETFAPDPAAAALYERSRARLAAFLDFYAGQT